MKAVFADTFFFVALMTQDDAKHEEANSIIDALKCRLVTTTWVVFEVGNTMSSPRYRAAFAQLVDWIQKDPLVEVLPPTSGQFLSALDLFRERPDKSWSLTDCASFVVMGDRDIHEALTGDHHFEQAGFIALLK